MPPLAMSAKLRAAGPNAAEFWPWFTTGVSIDSIPIG